MFIQTIGYCTLSTAELGTKMIVKRNSNSRGAPEGSKISFYCHDNESQLMMEATCTSSGNWSPDPNLYEFKCHNDIDTGKEIAGIIKR